MQHVLDGLHRGAAHRPARERTISFCRLRTFFRSPACVAVKIRCRSRRTSSSTRRQSTASQSMTSPSGPFTVTVSNLPIGSGVSVHLFFTGSPDPRQLPFGPGNRPYPTSYAESIRQRCGHAVPGSCRRFGCRPSLPGSSCARWGVHLPHGRPTGVDLPDPNGVVVLHMSKTRPGRAPS